MHKSTKLNYVEFASLNLDASKTFFTSAFGWSFTDYGNEYSAFSNAGLDGGIFAAEQVTRAESGAPLLVLYTPNISDAQHNIENAGATITKPLFDFPGGCRFHFVEPGGNELAVWSELA